MDRTQRLLVGILVAQVVLILLLRSPLAGSGGAVAAHPLLPALEAFVPARMEIDGADDQEVSMTRDDGAWVLDELGGFPADGKKVDELLDELRGLTVRRPVVSGSRYHDAFKVADDDHEGRIRLWAEGDDDPQVDLILGSSPNYRMLHVRVGGQTPVYEVRGLASYDVRADAAAWADKDLVAVSEPSLQALEIRNASGGFGLIREAGTWRVSAPESRRESELNQDEVDKLVQAATTVRLADPLGPVDDEASDAQHAVATVTLRLDDPEKGPQEIVYWIGGPVEGQESQRYVTRSGFGFRGTVWESSIKPLIDGKLDSLIGSESGDS